MAFRGLSGILLFGLMAIVVTMMVAHPGSAMQFRGADEPVLGRGLTEPRDEAVATSASNTEDVPSDAEVERTNDSLADENSSLEDEDTAFDDAQGDGKEESKAAASFVQENSRDDEDDDSADEDFGSNDGHAEEAGTDSDAFDVEGEDVDNDVTGVETQIQPHDNKV